MSTRAGFLAGTTALVVVAAEGGMRSFAMAADAPQTTTLGNWLRMLPDGTVEVFSDKVEMGMGTSTGFAMLVADELDVPLSTVRMMLGDTQNTYPAGGVGGSFSTWLGNSAIRHAAAEMRRILLASAATKLGVPAAQLTVSDGVISAKGDPTKSMRYTEVLASLFPDPSYPVFGEGAATDFKVTAQPKPWTDLGKVAGKATPRLDVAPKAFGRYPYVVDVKLPGMKHARMIYPPSIGATVLSVDKSSIAGIGDAKVVQIKDFVAVYASKEWDAVRAARALKVKWSGPSTKLPAMNQLAAHMWEQPVTKTSTAQGGDLTKASGTTVASEYFWPFQSHANMGPGCTVVDVTPENVTVYSGTQKTHALRQGMASLLKMPLSAVRVIWVSDAGSYGRSGLEESAAIAALVSQKIGHPVRVQSMRSDNTQWGNKSPAIVSKLKGTLQNGKIVGFDAVLRQYNGNEILSQPSQPGTFIAAQLSGVPNGNTLEYGQYGANSGKYEIPNYKSVAELIAPFAPSGSPLRTAHMRDPEGPGVTFIIESFIDELAAAAGQDAVDFRINHLKDPRHIEAVRAAAHAVNWETRPSGRRHAHNAQGELVGRGVAFATRAATIVATVAEVAVNPKTGKVRVTRVACAHDCGFIVNPKALQGTIEANIVQSTSRAIYEQATFNGHTVTSRDWLTYPVIKMREIPEVTVVMINRPTIPPAGAGEPASRTTTAAIANAVFDATGARVRTAPLTPENVLAVMNAKARS